MKIIILLLSLTFVPSAPATSLKCEQVGCMENDVYYPVGALVPQDDPCKTCHCGGDGLECTTMTCEAPGTGCVKYYPDQCCPVVYGIGEDIPTNDDCIESCHCQQNSIGEPEAICSHHDCPPHYPNCIYEPAPGRCCPVETCGCKENGIFYHVGEEVPNDDPCRSCYCEDYGKVSCRFLMMECSDPQEGCVYQNVPGQCCPELSYCGCMVDGTVYDFESDVPNDDPCLSCYCHENGEVSCEQKECSYPQEGCVFQNVPGKCCPELSYCGCMVDGTVYDFESEVPNDDPCNSCYCDFDGEVSCMQKECSSPQPGCVYQSFPGKCCPELVDCGCIVDATDYPHNSFVPNDDPCNSCYCDYGEVFCDTMKCSYPPPGCENSQPSPGVCCPDYQALGCEL